MKNRAIIGASIIVVGLLLLASMPVNLNTKAAPAVPHNTWGVAYNSVGVALASGDIISSWIDGVQYGSNSTWDDGFTFGMYDIDTAGNNTLDETPWVKEGGYYGEQIMYLHGDGTTTGVGPNIIFEENATWDSAASVNSDLNASDTTVAPFDTFEWLVINNVTVDSAAIPGSIDYVQIFNPGANPIDLFDYHFEKNDGQPVWTSPTFPITFTSVEMNPTLSTIPGGQRVWVNLSAIAGLDLDPLGDELKLVYPQSDADPETFEGLDFRHFLLQPMDGEALADNTRRAIEYCRRHPRWRLSLQTHKIIGIP